MKIWVNTIVNNEENFIYFALMSVVDHVDKILVWDTGSTDMTVQVIEEVKKIKKDKIIFKEVGKADADKLTLFRQEMLEQSDCDWILLVDGDEIWWEDSIKEVVNTINKKGEKMDGIVVRTILPVGDIYHIQEEAAGKYEILGRKGHFNLRAINRKISGLHVNDPYPLEGYRDINNKLVQESKRTVFLEIAYLHVTHLIRSSVKRSFDKFKYELGKKVEKDFKFPEILSKPAPEIIPSPWKKMSGLFWLTSLPLTPLRKIKRRI